MSRPVGTHIDMTGERYGMLTVLSLSDRKQKLGSKHSYWNCRCDCGNVKVVQRNNLISGNTNSCGCRKGRKCFT